MSGARCCAGTTSIAATFPGARLAIPIGSGSAKSCCSRRALPPCLTITEFSSNVFLMSKRSPRLLKMRCWQPGAVWATIAERGCFDGNVERVLQRFIGINLTTPQIWQHAQALLADSRPGDFNQAMMELGATVCVPREPRCPMCPVQKWCATQQSMERRASPPGGAPMPNSTRQVKKEIWCVLNQRIGGIRLVQRPRKASLMPGMWELPQTSELPRLLPASAHWRTFRHSITVTDYTVHVVRNTSLRNTPLPDAPPDAQGRWIAIDRIPQIPITGLTRKILKAGGII